MGENSKIEWTNSTFNPWWGCVKITEGCTNCYANAFDKRVGGSHWGANAERRFFSDAHWAKPLAWNRKAEKAGERHRVFCASMADVFEDRRDLDAPRARLWELIRATPHLDWLLLTKRPENLDQLVPGDWITTNRPGPPPNIWLGVTTENQHRADERIPTLLNHGAWAAVRP